MCLCLFNVTIDLDYTLKIILRVPLKQTSNIGLGITQSQSDTV